MILVYIVVGMAVVLLLVFLVLSQKEDTPTYQATYNAIYQPKRRKLISVRIEQEKALLFVTFFDPYAGEENEYAYPLSDEFLNSIFENVYPLSDFAEEIKARILALPDDWRRYRRILDFWEDAHRYIKEYYENRDLDSLMTLMTNIWDTRDKEYSALELHTLTGKAIGYAYALREANPDALDATFLLCELDISNFENLSLKIDIKDTNLISPYRKVIILEKKHLYREALEFCEWCHAQGIREERDKTFEARIERLKKKLK